MCINAILFWQRYKYNNYLYVKIAFIQMLRYPKGLRVYLILNHDRTKIRRQKGDMQLYTQYRILTLNTAGLTFILSTLL